MAPQLSNLRQRPGMLRIASLLLSLVGLIFIIVALCLHNTYEMVGFEASVYAFISLTTFAWTILWSISAICVLVFHGPYPAGVDIGLDFIGWGLAWGFGVVLIWWAADMNYPNNSCDLEYNSPGYCSRTKALMAMEVLGGIFGMGFGTCHLLLMITAIRALSAGKKAERTKSIDSKLQDGEYLTRAA